MSSTFGHDMLLDSKEVAVVVEPRVGQVWTMAALANVHMVG